MPASGLRISPGTCGDLIENALTDLRKNNVTDRIWSGDYSVWKPESDGIAGRLGWLRITRKMHEQTDRLDRLARDVQSRGYTHILLLGMGGSSLAPEVFRKSFGLCDGYPDLDILDSTDPATILYRAEQLDPARTLCIVASKSGTTLETISLLKYFYNWIANRETAEKAGGHFIAITDPGSMLAELAHRYSFMDTWINAPDIGGRFSALSYVGLLPAALMGVNINRILHSSLAMEKWCREDVLSMERGNPGGILGAVIGALALAGRDKLTVITSPVIASFGAWVEQLIAESTGKEGKGILPVVGEPVGPPEIYGDDRLFVYLKMAGDDSLDRKVAALEDAGNPVVRIYLDDLYDLGGQFFLWEMATAVAGWFLKINPFDQPDVESAKVMARRMMAEYTRNGTLPHENPVLTSGSIAVYGNVKAAGPKEALSVFLDLAGPGDYVAIQAFIQQTDETDHDLDELRMKIHARYRVATTFGYGPRYLHSTGQLHKGDAGRGLFIQLTADDQRDLPIPDEMGSVTSSLSFSALKRAQAMGDRTALLAGGRRVIRFHLGADVTGGITALRTAV
ncbi:MAG TPA: hypothetical protein PKZ42_10090 [Syntrophales bacterium]|nr:hypothetical protein [Syntrophales bacterium]